MLFNILVAIITIGTAILFCMVVRSLLYPIRQWLVKRRREDDKVLLRAAMEEEAYWQDVYEEILYEEPDRHAKNAIRQMARTRR